MWLTTHEDGSILAGAFPVATQLMKVSAAASRVTLIKHQRVSISASCLQFGRILRGYGWLSASVHVHCDKTA